MPLLSTELKQEVLEPKAPMEQIREFGDIYGLAKKVAEQKAKGETEALLDNEELN